MTDIKQLDIKSITSPSGVEFNVGDKVVFIPSYVDHIKGLDVGFTGEEVGILSEFVEIDREIMALTIFEYEHLKVKNFAEIIDRFMMVQ